MNNETIKVFHQGMAIKNKKKVNVNRKILNLAIDFLILTLIS